LSERLQYLEARPGRAARSRGTLVLIHAFPLNAKMWEGQLSLSEGGWRVIAPHLRGFHRTPYTPVQSMDDYAADLIDLLDSLHVEDAVIGGLSLGGYVAFALLRHAPHYFKGLILADTRAEADTPEGREGRKKTIALARESGPGAVVDQMIPKLVAPDTATKNPSVVERIRELALENDANAIAGAATAMMNRKDSMDLLAGVRFPALVIVGEHDALTPPELSERMKGGLPGAILQTIRGAGHLSNLEQPEAFNRVVADFLERRV